MEPTDTSLRVFASAEGEKAVMRAYDKVMNQWSVPFEEKMVQTKFGETHVIECGDSNATPIVFLHAMFATAASWYKVAPALSADFRVIAIDVLGEPNKTIPIRSIKNCDEYVEWFTEVVDALGLHRFVLVGNSMGGFISAQVAMRMRTRLLSLILISPASTFHSMMPFYIHCFVPKTVVTVMPWIPFKNAVVEHAIKWVRGNAEPDVVWEQLFRNTMLCGNSTNKVFPRVLNANECRSITCPTLLIVGNEERIYEAESVVNSAKEIMPSVFTEIVDGANHMAGISAPLEVSNVIRRFVSTKSSVNPLSGGRNAN